VLTLTCQKCGDEFEAKRSDAKTCSPRCRQAVSRRKRDPHIGSAWRRANQRAGLAFYLEQARLWNAWRDERAGGTASGLWHPSDGWWRHETMLAVNALTPCPEALRNARRRDAEIRELVRDVRLAIALATQRLTSAEFQARAIETTRFLLAAGLPGHLLTGLLQDIYEIAYWEVCVNAMIANDLREAIRLEGEKTREEIKDFITGTVIAREGHPVEAAEQILEDEG
jgi:hypothetical protein